MSVVCFEQCIFILKTHIDSRKKNIKLINTFILEHYVCLYSRNSPIKHVQSVTRHPVSYILISN